MSNWEDQQNSLLQSVVASIPTIQKDFNGSEIHNGLYVFKVSANTNHFLSRFTQRPFYMIVATPSSSSSDEQQPLLFKFKRIPMVFCGNLELLNTAGWHSADFVNEVVDVKCTQDLRPVDLTFARQVASLLATSRLELEEPIYFYTHCVDRDQIVYLMLRKANGAIEIGEVTASGCDRGSSKQPSSFAEYKLYQKTLGDLNEITVRFQWDQSETTVPESSSVLLTLDLIPASMTKSELYKEIQNSFTKELQNLTRINKMRQGVDGVGDVKSDSFIATSKFVLNFLSNFQKNNFASTNDDDLLLLNSIPKRNSHDFTDRLWSFCQWSICAEDLQETLTAVVDQVETGELKPFLSKSNETRIGRLIRESVILQTIRNDLNLDMKRENLARDFDSLLQEPKQVLDAVVEMGIAKLRMDYLWVLTSDGVLNGREIREFLQEEDSKTEQIFRLHVFNRILELWFVLKHCVYGLAKDQVRAIVQRSFSYWKTHLNSLNTEQVYSPMRYQIAIPANTTAAKAMVESVARNLEPFVLGYNYDSENITEINQLQESMYFENAGFAKTNNTITMLEKKTAEKGTKIYAKRNVFQQ